MKKEVFIEKALAVHGDKYDYSLLPNEFVNKDKVPVVCKDHGVFYITTGNHISNSRGCAKCGIEKVAAIKKERSKIKFFKEAPIIHNNKYDYSRVEYTTTETKVTIICPIHGDFEQTPYAHISGQGCRLCGATNRGIAQRDTAETFIAKAIATHGSIYDYSKVEYINQQTKVCIICPVHGEFLQQPNNHINGNGCPKCTPIKLKNKFMMTIEEFSDRVSSLHPTLKFDFSTYDGSNSFIQLECPVHGKSKQRARHLIIGHGCRACGIERGADIRSKDHTFYIDKFKEVHGDSYDYSLVNFSKSKYKFTVICKEHGEFRTTVNNHLKGKGCPKCAKYKSGFRSNLAGTFYILKVTEDCYKFGISNKFEDRLQSIQSKCVFDIEVLYRFEFEDGQIARSIEEDVIAELPVRGVVSSLDMRSGYTETFYAKDISLVLSIVDRYKPT